MLFVAGAALHALVGIILSMTLLMIELAAVGDKSFRARRYTAFIRTQADRTCGSDVDFIKN